MIIRQREFGAPGPALTQVKPSGGAPPASSSQGGLVISRNTLTRNLGPTAAAVTPPPCPSGMFPNGSGGCTPQEQVTLTPSSGLTSPPTTKNSAPVVPVPNTTLLLGAGGVLVLALLLKR